MNITLKYDGSFRGLLTAMFQGYRLGDSLNKVTYVPVQMDIMTIIIDVETEIDKAERIEKFIVEKISKEFFRDIKIVFLSSHEEKDTIIVKTFYRAIELGPNVLDSVEKYPLMMSKLRRQVLNERHRYLGLLRFREMEDKTLFATIEPKNNIAPLLLEHFQKRLGHKSFAIFDKKRQEIGFFDGRSFQIFFMANPKVESSREEEDYSKLWDVFYKSISIKERENFKRRSSNMPKYYWKHLTEKDSLL